MLLTDPDFVATGGNVQVVNDIYGIVEDQCILKITYAADTLSATEQVFDLANVRTEFLYSSSVEHMDFTRRHFAIMSPVQCDPDDPLDDYGNEFVMNPSIHVYQFSDLTWSCLDIDVTDASGDIAWTMPKTTV